LASLAHCIHVYPYHNPICRSAMRRRIVTFSIHSERGNAAPAHPMLCQRARITRALPFSLARGKPCATLLPRHHAAHATRAVSTHTRQPSMASPTPSKVHLSVPAAQQPLFYVKGISHEAAQKASELLQANHESHHIFFNKSGFHVCTYDRLVSSHPIPSHPTCLACCQKKRGGEWLY
jgi:hypothetical protein